MSTPLPPTFPPSPEYPADPAFPQTPQPSHGDVVQAGFLRRWAALFLDSLILAVTFYALFFVLILVVGVAGGFDAIGRIDSEEPPPWMVGAYLGVYLLYFALAGLYYALMESSSAQATVGKMALGIKVVDRDGRRLSFPHALGRWFAAALSYATLYIGFLIAAFTDKKQALHDFVVGSFVVDKWAYTDFPERQQRGLSGCLIVLFVVIVLGGAVIVLGILAAVAVPAYQDYVSRAHAIQAAVAAGPLKVQVAEAYAASGDCPDNRSDGFQAPADYADTAVSRIVVGRIDDYEDGGCGITVWMPPRQGAVEEESLVFEYFPDQGRWVCTSSLPDNALPPECR